MSRKRERLPQLRTLDAASQAAEEVEHELAYHIERVTEKLVAEGMDEASARAAALRRFGDLAEAKAVLSEQSAVRGRRVRRLESLDELRQDLRYALRALRRRPAFTLAAVLTLALGIGANTAMFGIAHGILFRPLPFADADRLVLLWQNNTVEGDERYPFSPANYVDLIERSKSFESVAVYGPVAEVTVNAGGSPERARNGMVSANYLDVAGVSPVLGRKFGSEDGVMGAPRVALISDAYWRTRFAGDRRVLGKQIDFMGMPVTIVGVLPRHFAEPTMKPVDIVQSLQFAEDSWTVRARHGMRLIARLRDGVTIEQARAEANTIFADLERTYPDTNRGMRVTLLDVRSALVGDVRTMLLVLLGAVGLVLLVACANITNLLLARAAERSREFSIRSALGAGRGRIVRQLLTESAVLAGAGALVGIWLATMILGGVRSTGSASLPLVDRVGLSLPVLFFAASTAALAVALVGALPALQSVRARALALYEEGRGSSSGLARQRVRRVLVVAQVALSLVLVTGAGLLIRSYRAIMAVDPGFEKENVLTFSVMKTGEEDERRQFVDELQRRIAALPGAAAVGAVSSLPLTGAGGRAQAHIENHSWGSRKAPEMRWRTATERYFDAMGLRVKRGRLFNDTDRNSDALPLIINEEAAARLFEQRDPIGSRVRLGPDSTAEWRMIIGVVENARNESLTEAVEPEVFVLHAQIPTHMMTVVVRTSTTPLSLVHSIRSIVSALDPQIVIADVRTTRDLIDASTAKPRFAAAVLGAFAGLGLLLAVVGTYGVLAYFVAQRQREISIRMALGADRRDVLRLIVGEGVRLGAYGLGIGVVGALMATRLLSGMLYQVEPTDWVAYVVTLTIIAGTVLLATAIPARRAAQLSPNSIMRE